ncbi:hypothetical protein, partial [Pseudanabaena biceps]|uniref:hypothetical protein n=1 Tax=Pseudanabaena biceps TaxID=927669 RepID=UPI0005930C23
MRLSVGVQDCGANATPLRDGIINPNFFLFPWRCCIKRGLEGKLSIKQEMRPRKMTEKYEIRNWSEYNAGLKQR